MASPDFDHLQERLGSLTERFVNFEIPPDRPPNAEELDSIACFKLLIHAEVETYIEDRVRFTVQKAIAAWQENRVLNRCAFNLLLRWHRETDAATGEFISAPQSADIERLLRGLQRRAIDEIGANNGIKQAAFIRLAALAGMASDDHSPPLLAALESYGRTRGEVAHRAVGRVRSLNSPQMEASDADQLIRHLRDFDDAIEALVNQ